MSKLIYKDKINLYKDKKVGLSTNSVSKKYGIRTSGVSYLVRLIDIHGYDILRTNKNKVYTKYEKQEVINRVLINNEPVWTVALDIELPSDSLLQTWIKNIRKWSII
jgi:transposase